MHVMLLVENQQYVDTTHMVAAVVRYSLSQKI